MFIFMYYNGTIMKYLLLLTLFLVACGGPFRPIAEQWCDPNIEPNLDRVQEFNADTDDLLSLNENLEMVSCLPSRGYRASLVDAKTIMSVKLTNLKQGDIIDYIFESQFTNGESYEHLLVTCVILSDSPTNMDGEFVSNCTGRNIMDRNTEHHSTRLRTGFFEVLEDTSKIYLNYVAYAASGYGRNGRWIGDSGLTIDLQYGQLDIKLERK